MAGCVLGNTLSESGWVTRGFWSINRNCFLVYPGNSRHRKRRGGPAKKKMVPFNELIIMIWLQSTFWDVDQLHRLTGTRLYACFRALSAGDVSAEYMIPTVLGSMISSSKDCLHVLPTTDRCFGMTYAQDKAITQRRIRELIGQGVYPERL